MGDSDIYWPVSSSDSSSESWMAGSMDWGYESDETDPEDIFTAPDHKIMRRLSLRHLMSLSQPLSI